MTKNSLDLWSESSLNKYEILPFQKYLKSDIINESILIKKKLVLYCNLTKVMFNNKKQPIQK